MKKIVTIISLFLILVMCRSNGEPVKTTDQVKESEVIPELAAEPQISDQELAEDQVLTVELENNIKKARQHYNAGVIAFRQRNYAEAEKKYLEALAIYPGYFAALGNMGVLSRIQGDHEKAIEFYEKALTLRPDNYFVNQNLAAVYLIKKDYQKALPIYQKLVALKKEHPEGYYGIGQVQIYQKNYAEALKQLLKAEKGYKRLQSDHIYDARFLIGYCYYQQDAYKKAVQYFEAAYPYYESSPQLNYFIGICYLSVKNKKPALARQYIQKAGDLGFHIPDKVSHYLGLSHQK